MGLFNGKNKDGNLKIQMQITQGLPKNGICYMIFDENNNKITFKHIEKRYPEVNLDFSKITSLSYASEEIIEKSNALGRAIVGGIVFGGIGAIVGATTAQDKQKTQYYKVINYTSNDEEKSIVLKSRGDIHEIKFFKMLSEKVTPPNQSPNTKPIDL